MTHPVDTTTHTTTYRSTLLTLPPTGAALRLVWDDDRTPESSRAWALSLPHGLGDGRVVNGPAEAHLPNTGFQKLFVVDPGEAHRHHLATVYGIRTAREALEAVRARLATGGDPRYRAHRGLLATLCSTPAGQRPAAHTVLGTVDPADHHVVVPFLSDTAVAALPEVPPAETTAWDVSVAVHLLWLAHGGGLVTGDECSDLLARALDSARSVYRTWAEYADGVVVGRAVADGRLDDSCLRFVRDVAVALNHPDSPWSRLELQG
ncbi:DUF1266 domain-containing protein [Corynebacterium kalidii]|uniref:DUF1266 domain-containing protein n=1 Tax=Corynebacterium kalidii TaxID=2931982 RepID=A0A9X1WQY7_9CORY|nr:DUF1266 domain-containing protein [Corynebacterium kalidii]